MNLASLSLNNAPGISVPLRFFMTAPLFAMLASLIWLMTGPELIQQRWLPATLAFTHALTLGFVTMIMIGALFQLLPVISGRGIVAARLTSTLTHALFSAGVPTLIAGFWFSHNGVIRIAMMMLALAMTVFLPLLTHTLFSQKATHAALLNMRVAVISLWLALGLGLWLLAGHAGLMPLPRQHTAIHIAWAAIGWINILIMAIAYQVIPMFQVTHDYPSVISRWLTPGMFLLLLIWTVLQFNRSPDWLVFIPELLLCMSLLIFISITLHLLLQRKKSQPDLNLYFWFTGMFGLLLSMLLYLYARAVNTDLDVVIGMSFLFGFILPIIKGMLYRIVPFLVWLHLNRKLAFKQPRSKLPTMHDIISPRASRVQFGVYLLAAGMTAMAFVFHDSLFYPAAGAWLANFTLLGANMWMAGLKYRRYLANT